MKQNLDTKVKHISLLTLKISFLTLHQVNPIFGYRVKITPDINPMQEGFVLNTPKMILVFQSMFWGFGINPNTTIKMMFVATLMLDRDQI